MKKRFFFIIVAILLLNNRSILLASSVQHGPLFKAFYSFSGVGISEVPYEDEDDVGSAATSAKDGETLNSVDNICFTLGYFYSWFQAEILYKKTELKNQETDQSDTEIAIESNASVKVYEFKIGRRFNIPGDSSYTFLYSGYKYFNLTSDLSDAEVKGHGLIFGINGYQSFDISTSLEFVIGYEFYIGLYKNNSLSFSRDINPEITNSLTVGASLGAGLLYEPYNIGVLFKVAPEYDMLKYTGNTGQSVDVDINVAATYIGVECIYAIPSFKYNER